MKKRIIIIILLLIILFLPVVFCILCAGGILYYWVSPNPALSRVPNTLEKDILVSSSGKDFVAEFEYNPYLNKVFFIRTEYEDYVYYNTRLFEYDLDTKQEKYITHLQLNKLRLDWETGDSHLASTKDGFLYVFSASEIYVFHEGDEYKMIEVKTKKEFAEGEEAMIDGESNPDYNKNIEKNCHQLADESHIIVSLGNYYANMFTRKDRAEPAFYIFKKSNGEELAVERFTCESFLNTQYNIRSSEELPEFAGKYKDKTTEIKTIFNNNREVETKFFSRLRILTIDDLTIKFDEYDCYSYCVKQRYQIFIDDDSYQYDNIGNKFRLSNNFFVFTDEGEAIILTEEGLVVFSSN